MYLSLHSCFAHLVRDKEISAHSYKTRRSRLDSQTVKPWSNAGAWSRAMLIQTEAEEVIYNCFGNALRQSKYF